MEYPLFVCVCISYMHELTPKVVAMAVSTVITMFRILLQSSLFSMMFQFSFV